MTVSDDLGGYAFDTTTVYPLNYVENSIRYYVNGVLQVAPATTAGPPFVITGINVPANSNAIIIYETNVTGFAPLDADSTIVNTASVTGDDLSSAVEATETVTVVDGFDLAIRKAINPAVISENGQLTYTFVIENYGNAEAVSTDDIVLTDTFDPVLNSIAVAYNGTAWVEGINYTYDETTGLFTSERGQITVPAATYTQNPDGTFSVTPGTAVITITGTI